MNWDFHFAGDPTAVAAQLDAKSVALTGDSKAHFDAHRSGIAAQAAANSGPNLHVEVAAAYRDDGTTRSLEIIVHPFHHA